MFGEKFDLENDEMILTINSPKGRLEGPYVVVYKDLAERWAIVAFLWDEFPVLGIRWFWDNNGNPISNYLPIWFVIPSALQNAILNGLPLEFQFRDKLNRFLAGEILGEELRKKGRSQ